jgi:hypothetical protein
MSGCVHGPVRYKTLGYHKYATVEFTKRSEPALKVLAAPAGVITDTLVTAIDTPVIVVWSVPLVFTHGGPDAAGCKKDPWIGVITFPFWYPVQLWAVCVWPRDMYQEVFGAEAGIFRESTAKSEESSQKITH